MAIMVPEIPETEISNLGERAVYVACRDQLPENWIVRFHYPATWMDHGYLRDFEVDFIVLAPELGIMVLEVKASFGFDCVKGIWHRVKQDGRREPTDNPFEQATRAKHRLIRRLSKSALGLARKSDFPGIYGHAVVYPRARRVGNLCGSQEPEVMIPQADMIQFEKRIRDAFLAWGDEDLGANFTLERCQLVANFLNDNCRFVFAQSVEVDEDEESITQLTEAQYQSFSRLLVAPRVSVPGTAGSGKTLIAKWIANEYAIRGKRVLLLCFNKNLASWMRCDESLKASGVEIASFFSLCRKIVGQANYPWEASLHDDFWTKRAAMLFSDALNKVEERYDVVIVDEAQDFHSDWWFPVQFLLKDTENGGLYIFHDPDQEGAYGHGGDIPYLEFESPLDRNCRNTKRIANYCSGFSGRPIQSFELSPLGTPPIIRDPVENPAHRTRVVSKLLRKLLEDYNPSQIALLSPWALSNDWNTIAGLGESVAGFPLKEGESAVPEWLSGECIFVSTIKAFKGLEADCVIVTDIPEMGRSRFSPTDLYVACSRAKHRLFMVPMSDTAYDELREHLGEE